MARFAFERAARAAEGGTPRVANPIQVGTEPAITFVVKQSRRPSVGDRGDPGVAIPIAQPAAFQSINAIVPRCAVSALGRALMACAGMLVARVEQEPGESASNRQSCSRASVSWPPDSA